MKVLIILSALLASSSAVAQPVTIIADPVPTAHVAFVDLDLTTDAGARVLDGRIHAAARGLCEEVGVEPLNVKLQRKACFNAAYADGAEQAKRIIASRRSQLAVAASSLQIQGN